jgi:ComF family protein
VRQLQERTQVLRSLASPGRTGVPPAVADELEQSEWSADEVGDYCVRCGATGPGEAMGPGGCAFCVNQRMPWDRVTRLGAYVPPLDGWIKAMKYRRQWPISPWMGRLLAERIGEPPVNARWSEEGPVVVHAPMHWTRRWWRGFDQAELMADGLARHRDWRHLPLLTRVRRTAPQTAIPPSQRTANVRRAFTIGELDLEGRDVILIDDVKTTGATLSQCARLLRSHGARTIHVAVAAVGDPRGQDFTVV